MLSSTTCSSSRAIWQDYRAALAGLNVWFVGVRCALGVVEQREALRPGRFPGTANSHFESVHAHGLDYDLEVDTSENDPNTCARQIMQRLATPPVAFALKQNVL